jgi:hypothetical protein
MANENSMDTIRHADMIMASDRQKWADTMRQESAYHRGYDFGWRYPTFDIMETNPEYVRGFIDGSADRIWELQHDGPEDYRS